MNNEALKNALCNSDLRFLEENKDKYSINQKFEDEGNDSLLLYAISDSKSNAYIYLLKNNADVSAINDNGENIIHAIVFSGDARRLNAIIGTYDVNINCQTKDGATPLLLAFSLERYEIAVSLIKLGADVNIGDETGIRPLHLAAQLSDVKMVQLLLDHKADPFLKTNGGNLALALAVNSGNIEAIRLLYNEMYGW